MRYLLLNEEDRVIGTTEDHGLAKRISESSDVRIETEMPISYSYLWYSCASWLNGLSGLFYALRRRVKWCKMCGQSTYNKSKLCSDACEARADRHSKAGCLI